MRLVLCTNTASRVVPDPGDLAARLRAAGATDVAAFGIEALGPPDGSGTDGSPVVSAARAADRLVVAGGDGSLGLAAAVAARTGRPLAVIPAGTANDFARAMGLPRALDAACALAARAHATCRRIELGRAGGRPFVNAAGAGLGPAAAARAHHLKPRLGRAAYGLGALRAGLAADPLEVRVAVDGERAFAGPAWQLLVACTGHFGGGAATGGTDPADGLLDVAVVPAGPRAALLRHAAAMRLGKLVGQRGVAHARGRRVEVRTPAGTPFNVDGELCEAPATFTVDPAALDVVVPA